MQIICCQLDIVWEDKKANHAKVLRMLEGARPKKGALVLLPEMFATGFSMNVEGVSDEKSRETQQFLGSLAREYGIFLLAGVVGGGIGCKGRNEAVLFGPEG